MQRLLLIVVALLALGVAGSSAQTTTRTYLPLTVRDSTPTPTATPPASARYALAGSLRSISAISDSVAWVAGDGGYAARTTDGGESWTSFDTGTGNTLYGIAAASAEIAWAVGIGGVIVATTDGGESWTLTTNVTSQNLNGITALSPQIAWAVGEGGTVLRTLDGGQTWSTRSIETVQTLMSIAAFDQNSAIAVSAEGTVHVTTDGGQTWSRAALGFFSLFGVTVAAPSRVWIVGGTHSGRVWTSDDRGATWSGPQDTDPYARSVSAADEGVAWHVASGGTIKRTTDGGVTWHRQESTAPALSYLTGVSAVSDQVVWVAGEGGVVRRTLDGGATWVNRDPSRALGSPRLYAVDAVDRSAWAVGAQGEIIATHDGGQTLSLQQSGTSEALWSVAAASDEVAWVGGPQQHLLKTTDGGATWSPQQVPDPWWGVDAIAARSPLEAYVSGGGLYRTTDGGQTWTALTPEPEGALWFVSIQPVAANTVWVSGYHGGHMGRVYRSTDDGSTWATVYQAMYHDRMNVAAHDEFIAWISGYPGNGPGVLTTDGGQTWRTLPETGGPALTSVAFESATVMWGVSEIGIFRSTDQGQTWARISQIPARSIALRTTDRGWAVGDGTLISLRSYPTPTATP